MPIERLAGETLTPARLRAVDAWAAAVLVSVVTQGRNVSGLRTFQRAGFLIVSVDLWFHKWYDG